MLKQQGVGDSSSFRALKNMEKSTPLRVFWHKDTVLHFFYFLKYAIKEATSFWSKSHFKSPSWKGAFWYSFICGFTSQMQVAITYRFFCWMLKSFPVLIISHLPWLYPVKEHFMASQSIMVKCIIPALKNTSASVRPSSCSTGAQWIICQRSSVAPRVHPPNHLFLAWRKRWKSLCGETGTIDAVVVNFNLKDKKSKLLYSPTRKPMLLK